MVSYVHGVIASRVFHERLTSEGGIFNNGLLFPYCFLEMFVGKALMEGDKVMMGDSQSPPVGKALARVGVPLATHL